MKNKKIAITAGAVLCAVSSLFIVVVAAAGVIGAAMQSITARATLLGEDGVSYDGSVQSFVMHAMQYIGYPYVLGSASPDSAFDCSGLTMYSLKQTAGIQVGHGATMQSRAFPTISKDALEFGDLLFFDWDNDGLRMEHVGIYIGSGQMLHAANPNDGVLIIALTSYYYNHMPCAGRPIGGGTEVIPAFDAYGSPISRITAEDTDALSRYLFSLEEVDPQKKLEAGVSIVNTARLYGTTIKWQVQRNCPQFMNYEKDPMSDNICRQSILGFINIWIPYGEEVQQ